MSVARDELDRVDDRVELGLQPPWAPAAEICGHEHRARTDVHDPDVRDLSGVPGAQPFAKARRRRDSEGRRRTGIACDQPAPGGAWPDSRSGRRAPGRRAPCAEASRPPRRPARRARPLAPSFRRPRADRAHRRRCRCRSRPVPHTPRRDAGPGRANGSGPAPTRANQGGGRRGPSAGRDTATPAGHRFPPRASAPSDDPLNSVARARRGLSAGCCSCARGEPTMVDRTATTPTAAAATVTTKAWRRRRRTAPRWSSSSKSGRATSSSARERNSLKRCSDIVVLLAQGVRQRLSAAAEA